MEFRPDGSLVRRWQRNPDGSEWTSLYEYDDAGRLMRIRTEDPDFNQSGRHHEYDVMGRLVHLVVSADGSDRLAESYDHDAHGRKKTTVYVDPAVQRPDTAYFWSFEGTDAVYSAPGAATVTTLHDASGQPIELLFRDVAGQTLSWWRGRPRARGDAT